MSQSHSATSKKRGRPTILKDYVDPMKSPMAYSSLQVQKSNQCFNKPLMRIPTSSVSPGKFKSPVKKSGAASSTTITFIDESSPPSSAESGNKSTSKFRGIVMNTPKRSTSGKAAASVQDSSPLTPLDSVFSSASRSQQLRSSPPAMLQDDFGSPLKKQCTSLSAKSAGAGGKAALPGRRMSGFNFTLSIDREGKACISDSKNVELKGEAEEVQDESDASAGLNEFLGGKATAAREERQEPVVPIMNFEKRHVLGLLKQMSKKAGGSDLVVEGKKNGQKRPDAYSSESVLCSPPPPPNTSSIPMTPRCTSVFQFKTGFTPCNISIDELLKSPQGRYTGSEKVVVSSVLNSSGANENGPAVSTTGSQHDHYVFKLSSGDPLLMNDEDSELLAQASHDPSELLQILNSPRRPLCFNTPPSWVNMGSPSRPSSLMKSDGHLQVPSIVLPRIDQPSVTPVNFTYENAANNLQCTPLIQQAMSGAFTKNHHIMPDVVHEKVNSRLEGSGDERRTLTIENGDARLALKKLIKGE